MYYILVVKMTEENQNGIGNRTREIEAETKRIEAETKRIEAETKRIAESNEKEAEAKIYDKIDLNTATGEKVAEGIMRDNTVRTIGEIEESIGKAFESGDPFKYKANDAIHTAMALFGDEKAGLMAYGAACRFGAETASRLGDEELKKDFAGLAKDYSAKLLEYYGMKSKPEEESSTIEGKPKEEEEEKPEEKYDTGEGKPKEEEEEKSEEKYDTGEGKPKEEKNRLISDQPNIENTAYLKGFLETAKYPDTGENIFYNVREEGDLVKATFESNKGEKMSFEYDTEKPITYVRKPDGPLRKLPEYLLNIEAVRELVSE